MNIIKNISKICAVAVVCLFASCSDYLDTPSFKVIETDAVWKDPKLINGVLVDLYYNMQQESFDYWNNTDAWKLQNPTSMSDEAQASFQKTPLWDNGSAIYNYEDGLFNNYSEIYKGIYNCNSFLEQINTASLSDSEKDALRAEVRFIRAWHYFTLVKRFGGVPLITSTSQYSGPESLASLQLPRDKESVIYDYIISEMEAVADLLPTQSQRSSADRYRVTSGAAWALCSRAAIYAGAIAKYGSLNQTIYPEYNWIVGIDPTLSNGYFQKSYNASQKVINQANSGVYRLADYETMFTNTTNGANGEYIFQRQYNVAGSKGHSWDKRNAPFSYRGGGWGCGMAPTLEMVEEYEYTDGSAGILKTTDAGGAPIRYDNPYDIFNDKDPRLFASVYLPGSPCSGTNIEIRRGIINSAGQKISATSQPGDNNDNYTDPVTNKVYALSGKDGFGYTGDQTKTGFYQKKYFDETLKDMNMEKSQTPWCVFRLAEMYLNLAEAGVELGGATNEQAALDAVNALRTRAGIKEHTTIDLEKVRHERRVELAFEGLRFWDMKRWRIAHLDAPVGLNSFKGTALCPYWDIRDNKYIFEKDPNTPKQTRIFLKKNYYTRFSASDINSNPNMRQNPEYTN